MLQLDPEAPESNNQRLILENEKLKTAANNEITIVRNVDTEKDETISLKRKARSENNNGTSWLSLTSENIQKFKKVKTEIIAIQSQLNEAQEDLVDERELLGMQTQTTDIWQGRFDKVYEIAKKMGADASVLNAIRDKPLTQGV